MYNDKNGKYIYENGDYYLGNFSLGKKEGQGIEYYRNNKKKYEGHFSNNMYNGCGKLLWR